MTPALPPPRTEIELGSSAPTEEPWPEPPTLRSIAKQHGRGFFTDSLVPLGLFLVGNALGGIVPAIALATAWSAGIVIQRRATGRKVGPIAWISLAFILIKGIAAIAARSEAVYFGPGIVTNGLIALLFIVSVAARRPAVGRIAPIFYPFPEELLRHPAFIRVFGRVTAAWAVYLAATTVLQVALMRSTGPGGFASIRAATSWPLMAALFAWSVHYPTRAFTKIPEIAARLPREPSPA